ncbi:hypothetical protein ASPZODRAFT_58617 [Penicilliopsis zonata CBS 506.65]|uniref:BZIP domain-containing protein n=1 Tax=Penicilliopsis zonata CBS 506.65 TaxID=1073090 RepID=A0A1L9SS35_9EURO|nr:hypothetical protein ASPZODRAFT_58617 [Penicilliopsis zonata CBS 506.65]OJJ49944.1 hypothetical protein ASPZODRAFT_58617 [Penicilliopsis zonata CBS 506.65]
MASRAPVDSAPPSLDLDLDPSSHHTELAQLDSTAPLPKREPSPLSTAQPASGAETPTGGEGDFSAAAGRKRKLHSTSARGVANLTPEQLAKKRANDRQAQRAIRERTKAHIDSLEKQVRELSSRKPFLDLQTALRQNEHLVAENQDMRRGLKNIMDIVQPLLGRHEISYLAAPGFQSKPVSQPPPPPPPPPTNLSPLPDIHNFTPHTHRSATGERSYPESIPSVETPSPTHPPPPLPDSRRSSATSADPSSTIRLALDQQRQNLAHGLDFSCSEDRLGFNFLLDSSQQVHRIDSIRRISDIARSSSSSTSSQLNNNNLTPLYTQPVNGSSTDSPVPSIIAPIRNIEPTCAIDAVLRDFLQARQQEAAQGVSKQKLAGPPYPSVLSLLNPEKSATSHPLSKVFTDLLRVFPEISTLPEQVAVLYTMFLLMRWQVYPTQENYDRLPEWLAPRPCQLLTPHPAWMDYLPWPRLRERVIISYQDYPLDSWSVPFTRDLSINWPYEAADCLLSTSESGELLINPIFERHLRNLANWSVGPSFAEAFPSLVDLVRVKPDVTCNSPHPYPPFR